jgi:glutaryl-CoA dehydrogenase
MYAIWRHGTEVQKQQWLPEMAAGRAIGCFGLTEPDAGSNPAAMRTTAHRDGTDWILRGSKAWITNGSIADVAVIWARAEDGVRGFVIPTKAPGLERHEIRQKLSLRASVTSELFLDEVRVPAEAAFSSPPGLRAPLLCLDEARFGIIFGAAGAARDCLEVASEYSASRTVFGRPLAGHQLTQAKLADMTVEWQKMMLLASHLAHRKDAGSVTSSQISLGKLNNTREALQIARTCRTILGANGISLEYAVMRHANNLESVLTYEGTVEVHQLVLGRELTGLSAFQ